MSLNNNNEAAQTREQRKKERKEKREKEATLSDRRKKIRIRLLPIWLRVIIVAVLIVASTALGAVVGYSVMGDGTAKEVFNKSTWMHIVDLINKEK